MRFNSLGEVSWGIKKNQVLAIYKAHFFWTPTPTLHNFFVRGILQNLPIDLLLSQDTKRGSSTVCLESSEKAPSHTKQVGKDKREFLDYDAT